MGTKQLYLVLSVLVLAGIMTFLNVMDSAKAQCTPTVGTTGAIVNCTGTDNNGFTGPNNMNITVQAGANVNNSSDTHLNAVRVNSGNVVNNDGTIMGVGYGGGDGLKGDHGNTIDNDGLIYSQHHDAVDIGDNNTLVNDNTIQSDGDKAIDAGNGLNLTNNADLIGTGDGVYTGSGSTIYNAPDAVIQSTNQDGIDAGSNLTLVNDGTISSGNPNGTPANDAIDASRNAHIDNNGTISGYCDGVDAGVRSTVVNDGTITSQNCRGVIVDYGSTVDNNGTISTNLTTGGSGVDLNNNSSLTNSGDITGRCRGVEGDANFTVINDGTITGIYCDGIYAAQGNTTIVNEGIIQTSRSGGDGIDMDYGTVDNAGTIYGISDGIEINGTVSGTTMIYNDGTISGGSRAINAAAADNQDVQNVTNAGVLQSGGSTTVDLGGGGDHFTAYVGSTSSGRIEGGTGFDTFIVSHDQAEDYPTVQQAAANASTTNCPCVLQFTVAGINFRYVYNNFERVTSEFRGMLTATISTTSEQPIAPTPSLTATVETAPLVEVTAAPVASEPITGASTVEMTTTTATMQPQVTTSTLQTVSRQTAPIASALPQFEGNRSNNITNSWAQLTKSYMKIVF